MANAFDATPGFIQDPEEIRRFLRQVFAPEELKGKTVLDAGCRNGDYAAELLRQGAASVVGVDLSRPCIEAARARFPGESRLRFVEGSITSLRDFPDSTFDVIICVGTIVYLPPRDMIRALEEFLRVGRPGGAILVLFQKEKGLFVRLARALAGALPLRLFVALARLAAPLLRPVLAKLLNRKISPTCAEYLLISLRGVYFGMPALMPESFRIQTPTCEHCSEAATMSYKIRIPDQKAPPPWKALP
ncbi:MAG TPA: hypothetical protein DEB40_00870 [Elusimicrobia bacterium]|nr:hypothetical protein [Elusimicrobiota bacterium]HBT60281.1 hypothetical protein [Elusimicrobiota bacterium]